MVVDMLWNQNVSTPSLEREFWELVKLFNKQQQFESKHCHCPKNVFLWEQEHFCQMVFYEEAHCV